jgi:hypothetical protein
MTYRIRVHCPTCRGPTPHTPVKCLSWLGPGAWLWYGQPFSKDQNFETRGEAEDKAATLAHPLGWLYEVVDMDKPMPPLTEPTEPTEPPPEDPLAGVDIPF